MGEALASLAGHANQLPLAEWMGEVAHIMCRSSFLMQCLRVTGWGSWTLTLVFQSWEKAAFQNWPGAGIQGSKEGFV